MQILLVDNGTSYLPELKRMLAAATVTTVGFERLKDHEGDKFDLIILSGGHKFTIMSHARKYSRELSLIKNTKTPIIGICLGFELIVVAFGGSLKLLRRKVKRAVRISFSQADPISPKLGSLTVFERHQRGVKRLPDSLAALATSSNGVEIIKHANLPIYGFQFHPEMEEAGQGINVIQRTIHLLTKATKT